MLAASSEQDDLQQFGGDERNNSEIAEELVELLVVAKSELQVIGSYPAKEVRKQHRHRCYYASPATERILTFTFYCPSQCSLNLSARYSRTAARLRQRGTLARWCKYAWCTSCASGDDTTDAR